MAIAVPDWLVWAWRWIWRARGRSVVQLERRRRAGAVQTLDDASADNSMHLFLGAFTCCLARLELLGSCHELRELGTSCRVEWQGRLLTLPLGAPRPQTLLALARLGRPGWQLAAGLWRLLDCRASQGEYAAALPSTVPACAPVRWWRPSGANGSCRSSTRLWTNWTRCWPCAPAGLAGGSAPPSPAGGGAFPGGPVDPAPERALSAPARDC